MKLNNKGVTLVEIIISVVLISIVLVFLFTMLIQVNNENAENEVNSSYLVNQAAFIKQVEEDFLDYGLDITRVSDCSASVKTGSLEVTDTLTLPNLKDNIKCLNFEYTNQTLDTSDDIFAYLFLYERTTPTVDSTEKIDYVLSYFRSDGFRQSVILEDYVWDSTSPKYSTNNNYCSNLSASLPIKGPDDNDYSINLSYANCE